MTKYAVLNNNIVTEILDLDDEGYALKIQTSQTIINIEDLLPQPEVGWLLVGNTITPASPLSPEQKLITVMEMRFKFGNKLADSMVKKLSIKNVELIALGQVLNIGVVIQTFSGIEAAMRKCAIPTARGGIAALAGAYPEYASEFAYALAEIDNYLALENAL